MRADQKVAGAGRFEAVQPPGRQARRPPGRRRPLSAIGASLVLAALLVGVPLALTRLGGGLPLPTLPLSWPSRETLTQPLGVVQVVTVLLTVVWLAWLQFVICTFVEAVAAIRGGVLARPVPLAGPSQRLARALVAGLLLSALLTAESAGAATPARAPATIVSVEAAGPGTAAHAADAAAAQPALRGATDRSQRTDHPELGAAGEMVGHKVYVVRPAHDHHHDSLWEIAERHLGDGRRYREIYTLNKGRPQPDGRTLELARLIQPGWQLLMPEDAVGVERVVAPAVLPAETAHPQKAAEGAEVVGAAHSSVPAAEQVQPAAQVHAVQGEHEVHQVRSVSVESAPAVDPGAVVVVWFGLVSAGLLGAGLLSALVRLRRRRGSAAAAPPPRAAEAEVWLRVGADPVRAQFVADALGCLALSCRDTVTPLPQVYAATADDETFTLLLAPPAREAPAPWTVLDDGATWLVHRSQLPPRGAAPAAAQLPSPIPALVSLGRDVRGRDLLVDLGAAGGPICVVGDASAAEHVVRALAVELATNPWSRDVQVTALDLPVALARFGDRLEVPEAVGDPLAGLRSRVQPTALDGVLSGHRAIDGGLREHVVLGRPPERDVADDLRRLGAGGRLGILVAGDAPGARWTFTIDAAGSLSVEELGLVVTANRLDDAMIGELDGLFCAATGLSVDPMAVAQSSAPQSAGSQSVHSPSVQSLTGVAESVAPIPPVPVDDGAWAAAPARIGVLGPVLVRAPGALDAARLEQATELVAYLALHPEGVHPTVLAGALWPRGVTADVRDATVARTRDWLGLDEQGSHRLRRAADDRLQLSPGVVLDWDVLCTLLDRARRSRGRTSERDLLVRALHLVRGPFAGGVTIGPYAWLARTPLERVVPVVIAEAAHRLVLLCLDADEPAAAGEAARCGLRANPCAQELWRDLLRAEHAQWGADGARQAAAHMAEVLADLGTDADPLTLALVAELSPGHGLAALGT